MMTTRKHQLNKEAISPSTYSWGTKKHIRSGRTPGILLNVLYDADVGVVRGKILR